jgi:hypothetical protein
MNNLTPYHYVKLPYVLCAKKDKKFDSQLVFLSFFLFNLTAQLPVSGTWEAYTGNVVICNSDSLYYEQDTRSKKLL